MQFKTFGDPKLVSALAACWEWVSAFQSGQSPRWLTLIGSTETGKTKCCTRLWKWAEGRARWCDCAYLPQKIFWPDFVQRLRSGNAYGFRDDLKRWPVLFLDDIGSERDPSGFAAEELVTLLGMRIGKWTLTTSNLMMNAIEDIDVRLANRLVRGQNIVVEMDTIPYSMR